jgi:hypothetical protein
MMGYANYSNDVHEPEHIIQKKKSQQVKIYGIATKKKKKKNHNRHTQRYIFKFKHFS